MHALEHRLPPPAVALAVAAAMWLVAHFTPRIDVDSTVRLGLTAAFAGAAAVFAGLGISMFGRAKTTINPVRIDQVSALVTTGVYGVTRNPMYLGLALLLCACTCYLAAPWVLLGPVAFVAFISRFQIAPEERALHERFGAAFDDYRRRVRRWI